MSQDKDNNEAASTPDLHSAIMNLPCDVEKCATKDWPLAYKYGHRDARHAAAELVAASASQSSTPVPRVGGNTSEVIALLEELSKWGGQGGMIKANEFVGRAKSALAHVARQRQESTAVAEGVDTPELRKLLLSIREAKHALAIGARTERLIAHIETVYGAQQREAGRREEPMRKRVEDFARRGGWGGESGEGAFEFVQRISYEQGRNDALRQPVSGLTQERLVGLPQYAEVHKGGEKFELEHVATGYRNALVYVNDVQALISAVPPAKAEGMSDTARIEHMEAWLLEGKESGFHWNTFAFDTDKTVRAQLDLAQQAKKGNQQ